MCVLGKKTVKDLDSRILVFLKKLSWQLADWQYYCDCVEVREMRKAEEEVDKILTLKGAMRKIGEDVESSGLLENGMDKGES